MLNSYATSGNSPTSVYLIGNVKSRVFKIGVADDASRRLKQIATACPYSLSILEQHEVDNRDLAFKVEKALHELYADKRIRPDGEWFSEVDQEHFKQSAETTVAMLKQEEEEKKNSKYVSEYTEWYHSTKQTQGEHPAMVSLRLLGMTECPACPKNYFHSQEIVEQDGKVYCRQYGTLTLKALCDLSLQERDRDPIPTEWPI